MSVKTKAQLASDIDSNIVENNDQLITATQVNELLNNIVDSYEDVFATVTTAQRNLLAPSQGQKIFNTDSKRVEIYSGTEWRPAAQKGGINLDCSGNPNYPEGLLGDFYRVSTAGKIGGASGADVFVDDWVLCIAANAGGTQASVGSNWVINRSAGTGFNDILVATVSLNNAALSTLKDTPVQAIAAPGAGKVIMPVSWIAVYTYATSVFSSTAGPTNFIFDTATRSLGVAFPDLKDIGASAVCTNNNIEAAWSNTIANKALMVQSKLANHAGGGGSVALIIFYKIVTL